MIVLGLIPFPVALCCREDEVDVKTCRKESFRPESSTLDT